MFADFYHIKNQDLSIPENYPTHPQAEVLVFNRIPVQYIKAICFGNVDAKNRWLHNSTEADNELSEYRFYTERYYFNARRDYAKWRLENF